MKSNRPVEIASSLGSEVWEMPEALHWIEFLGKVG